MYVLRAVMHPKNEGAGNCFEDLEKGVTFEQLPNVQT